MKRADIVYRETRRSGRVADFVRRWAPGDPRRRLVLLVSPGYEHTERVRRIADSYRQDGYLVLLVAPGPLRMDYAVGQLGDLPLVRPNTVELTEVARSADLAMAFKFPARRAVVALDACQFDALYTVGSVGLELGAAVMRTLSYQRRVIWLHHLDQLPELAGGLPDTLAGIHRARAHDRFLGLPDVTIFPDQDVRDRLEGDLCLAGPCAITVPEPAQAGPQPYSARGPAVVKRAGTQALAPQGPGPRDTGQGGGQLASGGVNWAPAFAAVLQATDRLLAAPRQWNRGVFLGPHTSAGQPCQIARALRARGEPAQSVHMGRYVRLDLDTDAQWPTETIYDQGGLARWALNRFDLFHLHFRPIVLNTAGEALRAPSFLDMRLARQAGKPVVFQFRGSEARLHQVFARRNPFAWTDPTYPTGFGDDLKATMIDTVRDLADAILVPDPELQTYVPEARVVPRMVDLNRLGFVGPVSADEPLIVHAPTRRGAKGTDVLMDAVERLRAEGYRFRFELFEDLAHAELIERLRAADIVVDQLLIGWYGVLSVEAMALGKVPVAYLRPDLRHHVPEEVLAEASPDTIYRVLRDLVRDPGLRARIGHAARGYAERVHGPEAVMQRLDAVYAEVRAAHEDRPAVPPDTSALAGRVRAAARGRIPQRLLGLGVQRHPHQLRRPLPIRATNWLAKRLRGKR